MEREPLQIFLDDQLGLERESRDENEGRGKNGRKKSFESGGNAR